MDNTEKMKAIIQTKNGPPEVLQLREVPKPIPKENEVLIKVYAGTVTIGDAILRGLRIPGFLWFLLQIIGFPPRKKIPGHEVAGEIEAVGESVRLFRRGDQVFGTTSGLINGGNAEYVCVPEEWKEGVLAIKPTNMSYTEAAALSIGGMTALHILRKGNIQNGKKVLIYGASGSVGTF
ncbi:MAG: NAD(P)-dependent alcohol dehydrogenase, partial [Candidatus Heimdallarchaeota archaeon]